MRSGPADGTVAGTLGRTDGDVSEHPTPEQVATSEDVTGLWRELLEAKRRQDDDLVRTIENRMAELGRQRRFAHLSDEDLRAQIRGLSGNREPEGLLAYSPADGEGIEGASDTAALNRAIAANQHVGVEVALAALLDEWRRRRSR